MELLRLSQAQKHYKMGDETVRALDGVSFNIQSGEYFAILGSSGSGKSTLMHILGFMDQATNGDYYFEGKNVSHIDDRERALIRARKIGFVFQTFNLLPRLSVINNVLLPISYSRDGRTKQQRHDAAQTALSRVGLEHRLSHMPGQLSGGERQRVSIARALINKPSLILADEPTGNLDTANRDKTLALFAELHSEGNTIILVTHDPEVATHAKRTIEMSDGKIIRNTGGDT